ncbi:MAG: hypothetical protein WBD38_11640 [Candidatus Dormiibacterota bacterium]
MSPRAALALLLTFVGALALGYGGTQAIRATQATSPVASSTPAGRASPSPAGPAPTPSLDLTGLAHRCASIPTGTVAAYLQPATLIHGTEPDPRTGQNLPVLRTTIDAEVPATRPAFSIAAAVQESGKSAGGGAQPVDRMGSLQLWMYWDGTQLHKGVRRWTGSSWAMAVDGDATSLTIELRTHSAAFHSGDVKTGATFAVVTADSGGCTALGVDSQGRPASGF